MRPKKFFLVMIGSVGLLLILLIGSAVGGNILLKKQSAKLNDLKLQSRVLQEQQTSLIKSKRDIEKYAELDAVAKTIVPQDKDQAVTVRTISSIAQQSGIPLKSITFAASTLGQAAPTTPTNSDETAAKTTTAKTTAPPVTIPSQSKAVPGITGVFALEITVASDEGRPVPYSRLLDFLQRLENTRRTSHVSGITISPSTNPNNVSFTLTLQAYLKP